MRSEEVMLKALKILEKELTNEEFLIYLQTITKKTGDSVKELREKTKKLHISNVIEMAKKFED